MSEGPRIRRTDDVVPIQKLAGLRPWKNKCFDSNLKAGKKPIVQFEGSQSCPSYLRRLSSFVLVRPSTHWDGAHPHLAGRSALLSLQIQTLISPKNMFIETPRIMFEQLSGHPVAQ